MKLNIRYKNKKTLKIKYKVLFINKINTIKNIIDFFIYLSPFKFLPRFQIFDLFIFFELLY